MKKTLNIKDISPFIGEGGYVTDIALHHLPDWIKEHQESDGLILDPDFQRGHVWTPEQEIAFMEFALRGGHSARDLYFNHPGWMNDFQGEFVCVDGLQRITAICRFFDDKVPVFGEYVASQIEGLRSAGFQFGMRIHINSLQNRNDVIRWYIEMNEGGTPHSAEEISRVRSLIKD